MAGLEPFEVGTYLEHRLKLRNVNCHDGFYVDQFTGDYSEYIEREKHRTISHETRIVTVTATEWS